MAGFDASYKACLTEAHLVCSICDGPLRKPLILPCFHAYCSACLKSREAESEDGILVCPKCNVAVVSEKIRNLPAVHFLQTLQDVIKSNRFERKSCSLCNRDKYAIWTCKTCQENLCGQCKQRHQRKNGHETHTEFEFLDSAVKEICQRRNDFYCDDHSEEILAYFCTTCSKTICVVCESTRHENHDTQRLSKTADALRQNLAKSERRFTADFERLKYLDEKRNFHESEERTRLEEEVTSWVKKLKDQLDQRANEIRHQISQTYPSQRPQDVTAKWSSVSYFPKQLSDYGSDVEVIKLSNAVTRKFQEIREESSLPVAEGGDLSFHPRLDSTSSGRIVSIGDINGKSPRGSKAVSFEGDNPAPEDESHPVSMGINSSIPRAKQISSFQAEWDVTGISVTRQNEYLVNSRLRKACLVYKPSGELLRQVKLRGQNPFDVTVLKNGNYVITDREAKKVNVFSPDGQFSETLKIEIGEPAGVAALSNGDLVISDLKQKDVCIFSPHRKMFPLKSLKSENGNQIFKWPLYVAVNSVDEIIVSDNELHSVKIFDKNGKLRSQYGFYGEDGGKLRGPRGVCTDSRDNIFVTDYTNDRVHALLPDGKFYRVLIGREEGLSGPRVVAMDTMGRLVVGQENATIKIIECRK